jgi:RNA polymerase sigma factor (sigma-70 family)
MNEDAELLSRYAEEKSEAAFAELVRRQVNFVHAAALRRVGGDAQLAQEVTQQVFTALARDAKVLARHPVLCGWMFTATRRIAAQTVRTETRRRAREQAAFIMNEINPTGAPQPDWERLRPELDAVLDQLGERDREAVLLRFFEARSFGEIGGRLRLSENAARMRVERALDKMHATLASRGVSSTTAALGLALTAQAASVAPVGLAASVTGVALAGAATGAGGMAGVLTFMSITKLAAGVVTIVAILAVGVAVYEGREVRRSVAAVTEGAREREDLRAKLASLEARYEAEAKRVRESEEDNARLLVAVQDVLNGKFAQNGNTTGPITFEMVGVRYRSALEAAQRGDVAAALKGYLWCFDDGMTRVSTYRVARRGALLNALAKLGEQYPEASAALRARRDQAETSMKSSAYDIDSTADFVALNRALKNDERTLELYDRLPADDPKRNAMTFLAFDQFVAAQRYNDAAAGKNYQQMNLQFERISKFVPLASVTNPEEIQKSNRDYAVSTTMSSIEVLAGAGDLAHARELAGKLLAYDGSEATRSLLAQRLARAGQAGLLGGTGK